MGTLWTIVCLRSCRYVAAGSNVSRCIPHSLYYISLLSLFKSVLVGIGVANGKIIREEETEQVTTLHPPSEPNRSTGYIQKHDSKNECASRLVLLHQLQNKDTNRSISRMTTKLSETLAKMVDGSGGSALIVVLRRNEFGQCDGQNDSNDSEDGKRNPEADPALATGSPSVVNCFVCFLQTIKNGRQCVY